MSRALLAQQNTMLMKINIASVGEKLEEYKQELATYLLNQESDKNQLNKVLKVTPFQLSQTDSGQQFQTVINQLQLISKNILDLIKQNQLYNKRIQFYIEQVVMQLNELLFTKRNTNLNMLSDFKSQVDEIEVMKEKLALGVETNLTTILEANLSAQISKQNNILWAIISSDNITKEQLDQEGRENIEYLESLLIQEQAINRVKEKIDEVSEIMHTQKQQLDDLDQMQKKAQQDIDRISQDKQAELKNRKFLNQFNEKERQVRKEKAENLLQKLMEQKDSLILQVDKNKRNQMQRNEAQNDMFNEQIMGLNESTASFFRIFVFDQSGSMCGPPFNEAIRAVREILADLKADSNYSDSFCLIQVGSSVRTMVSRTPIKSYDVNSLPNSFACGGTDFEAAFRQTRMELERSSSQDRLQIIFLTDRGDSDRYRIVLREIVNQFQSQNLSLFCVGYGGVDTAQLKPCSLIINGDEQFLKLLNGDKVQTLFSVSDVRELSKVFAKIKKETPIDLTQIAYKAELLKKLNQEYNDQMENMDQQRLNFLLAQIKLFKEEKEGIEKENSLLSTDIESSVNTLYEENLRQVNQNNTDLQNQINKLLFERQKQNSTKEKLETELNSQQKVLIHQKNFKKYHFERYQNEIEQCIKVERRQINMLRQIRESMFYAFSSIDQLRLSIKQYEEAFTDYREPNTQELNDILIQVLLIQEKLDPEQLVIRVISEVVPSFEKRFESLKNPNLFKEKVLAPILSEEMWPVVKSLVFVQNEDPKYRSVTFDEYSRDILLQFYRSTDEDLKKKQKELDRFSEKVSFIQNLIINAENKKVFIQENFEKQLTAFSQRLENEFEKKIAKAGDDSDKVEELEEAKSDKLSAFTKKEEEKLQKEKEKLENKIEKLQGDLEVTEEMKFDVSEEYTIAMENFMNNFQSEFDLIQMALKNVRIAADRLKIAFQENKMKVHLMRILERATNCYYQLVPEEEQSKIMVEQQQQP